MNRLTLIRGGDSANGEQALPSDQAERGHALELLDTLERLLRLLGRYGGSPTSGRLLRELQRECWRVQEAAAASELLRGAAEDWVTSYGDYQRESDDGCDLIRVVGWQWSRGDRGAYTADIEDALRGLREDAERLLDSSISLARAVQVAAATEAQQWRGKSEELADRMTSLELATMSLKLDALRSK